jgi:hypothetical protein
MSSDTPEQREETRGSDTVRAALASRQWRASVRRMGEDADLAIDPLRVALPEAALAPAFAAFSQVMLKMRAAPAESRIAYFAAARQELGLESPEEGQQIWMGLLAWGEAHPPRATLLARLQQAYLDANRSWPTFQAGRLRPALMARALFYSRPAAWRKAARGAAGGLAGDPRGQVIREDLFLWMGGLVEWARQPIGGSGYLATGELRASLLSGLGIPAADQRCLEGVLTAAGHPGPDPWDARLVRSAGLVMTSADLTLELVRHMFSAPEREVAVQNWEDELESAGELVRKPWVRDSVIAGAARLVELMERHADAARGAETIERVEEEVRTAQGRGALGAGTRPFALSDHFAGVDVLYAWVSLRDLVRSREPVEAPEAPPPAEPPAPTAESLEPRSSRGEPADPDPAVVEIALSSAWKYGRRLVGRDPKLGYRVLAPLVDHHWNQLGSSFLELVTRHPPSASDDQELIIGVLVHEGRGAAVAGALLGALAKQRHAGRWPALLEAVLARLPAEELRGLLPRAGGVITDRRAELSTLLPGIIGFWEKIGEPAAGLDLALRYFGPQGRGGPDALAHAARLARGLDWERGGKPVLEAARDQGELVADAWERILELCAAADRIPDALALLLSWASRSITPRGEEKQRERLAVEWNQALELAARTPEWETGFGQVWAIAQESSCPVPAVWRALADEAQAREVPSIFREGSKRFVEAWGADAAITQQLWEALERESLPGAGQQSEVVDLLHWLHVDLGHNRWTTEAEFSRRVLALPGMTPRILGEWAVRKLYSSRRWALLGAALANDPGALDTLLDVVREMGHPIARALEGLVQGLPEERSWPFLIRLLPGPAWSLEWAWMEVLRRWKFSPGPRSDELRALLPVMPAPQGVVTPAFEHECRLLLGYLLANEPSDRWAQIAAPFQRVAAGTPTWNDLLAGLVGGSRGPTIYEHMIAELVEPLDSEIALAAHARALRDRLAALVQLRHEPLRGFGQ